MKAVMAVWRNYQFRPTLWPTLFTIPAVLLMLWLGTWQMQRLEWKNALLDRIATRMAAPAVPLPDHISTPDDWDYRRITVTGRLLNDQEMPVAASSLNGQVGFQILVPLLRDDGRHAGAG